LQVIVELVLLVELGDDLNDSLLVLGNLFHEFVFVVFAVFSFVKMVDYYMFHVPQVLDYLDDVEVFGDFVFA